MSQHPDAIRILELRRELERHNRLYYVEAQPVLKDREYDLLFDELKALEAKHPELISPDSPTQRVGGEPLKEFQRVQHRAPMLSLEKKEDLRELELFEKEIRKTVPDFQPDYVVEPKIDGVSLSLHYVDGQLVQAVTRGDGEYGDDITVNVRTLKDIPLRLLGDTPAPPYLEVRGEVYMRESDRIALNEKLRARGDKTFANTRNATAGSLKQLDPRIVAERPLRAVFYALGHTEGIAFPSHTEELAALRAFGLSVPGAWRRAGSMAKAEEAARAMKEEEVQFPYEIDGCVIKVNDNAVCQRLGLKTNVPAYAVAYKRPEWFNEATTKLLRIVVQVGRTGVLTPVAEVEPVFLDGTTISRMTLHNAEEIQRKDIRIGDTIVIKRAGRVIPAVVRVLDDQRSGNEAVFQFPDRCPACGAPVERREQIAGEGLQTAIRCTNLTCPAQTAERINYLASRSVLDIQGLGEAVAERLVETGMVKSPLDLFRLNRDQLAGLNIGSATKPILLGALRAQTILSALDQARRASFELWIKALGIPGVGEAGAIVLAQRHASFSELAQSPLLALVARFRRTEELRKKISPRSRINPPKSEEEAKARTMQNDQLKEEGLKLSAEIEQLGGGKDIDLPMAEGVLAFFQSAAGRHFLEQCPLVGITPQKDSGQNDRPSVSFFADKSVAITGTISGFSRDEIKAFLREHGAKFSSSISKNTQLLIAGANAGSKLDEAMALGVQILDEKAFLALHQGSGASTSRAGTQGTLALE